MVGGCPCLLHHDHGAQVPESGLFLHVWFSSATSESDRCRPWLTSAATAPVCTTFVPRTGALPTCLRTVASTQTSWFGRT